MLRYKIRDMKKLAQNRHGKCLSDLYINNKTKLDWECKECHVWKAIPTSIRRGSWCPTCAGVKKGSIDKFEKIAKSKWGSCLSKNYVNKKTKLKFKCSKGHIWKTTPDSISSGTWCPFCSKKVKHTIVEMKHLARARKGQCLSKNYINNQTKLLWKCEYGHKWFVNSNHIMTGRWCPYCKGKYKTINDMILLAKKRDGKCLSKKYVDDKTKLKWQCREGHTWIARPNHILRGRWCPICSRGKTERICRSIFEVLLNSKFPSKRPLWLKNDKGNRLELDGYNEELFLAFEYNGEQHYKVCGGFYTSDKYRRILENDKIKKLNCRFHGVKLIEIPHFTDINKLVEFIKTKLKENKIRFLDTSINLVKLSRDSLSSKYFKALKKKVKQKNGKCLSPAYINSRTKITFQCKRGHIWDAIPNNVQRGSWCPTCAKETLKNGKGVIFLPSPNPPHPIHPANNVKQKL